MFAVVADVKRSQAMIPSSDKARFYDSKSSFGSVAERMYQRNAAPVNGMGALSPSLLCFL